MSDDVTKRPVHDVLTQQTHVGALQRRFGAQTASIPLPEEQPLPKAPKGPERQRIERPVMGGTGAMMKQDSLKRKLLVFYDALPVPAYPKEKTPPCESCKTSACCSSFMVNLRKEEYESGLYAPYAVKFTPEAIKQLKGFKPWNSLVTKDDKNVYAIEGTPGEPCPFLGEDYKCGIYDVRPLTCREYTCVGDARITDAIRNGEET